MKKPVLYLIYAAALFALLYFDKFLCLVMSVLNYAVTPIRFPGFLLFLIGFILIITVEILRHHYPIRSPKLSISTSDAYPLYNDQPSNADSYGRSTSACLLISKIFSTFTTQQLLGSDGALVININEAYGAGKTTFLKIIEQELATSHQDQYILINFRPWLCESEQAIIRELFTLLGNQLNIDSVKSDLRQYLHLLLLQTEQIAPAELKPFYAFIPHKLSNKTLQQLHDDIKTSLQHIDRPIIVTIDDVDRLQEKELTAVLKLIRDTADFPNIFYIVAADNHHLEVMLHNQGIENSAVFLQKFFNLDFLLPAHESIPTKILQKELDGILRKYGYTPKVVSTSLIMLLQIPHLNKIFANLRDVYRFLNVYTSSLDLLRSNNNLFNIDPHELFCLTIIRHLRIDIYKILRDRNDELLEVVFQGNDSYHRMKPDANIAKIQKDKRMRHISQARGNITSPEELNRQRDAEEKRTLDEALKMTEISSDIIVSALLDRLFGNPRPKGVFSICRSNVYFLYFTGCFESTKLSTAESVYIINMSQEEYENKLNQLLKTNHLNSFRYNFTYAYSKSKIDREEAMKKFYILQKIQYQHRKNNDSSILELFEEFINRNHESFMAFLFELYGNHIAHNDTEFQNSIKAQLEAYCKTESDLHMLILAFSIISSQLSSYCLGRDFLERMFNLLSDRLICEKMTKDHVNQVEPTTFETIRLIKDEFTYKDKWLEKFESFLDEDVSRCRQWLGYMVDILPNGNIDWNYHHHDAVLGENANSGEKLLNHLKQKFPDSSKAIEELSRMQALSSLEGSLSKNSYYYQMIREAHGI